LDEPKVVDHDCESELRRAAAVVAPRERAAVIRHVLAAIKLSLRQRVYDVECLLRRLHAERVSHRLVDRLAVVRTNHEQRSLVAKPEDCLVLRGERLAAIPAAWRPEL